MLGLLISSTFMSLSYMRPSRTFLTRSASDGSLLRCIAAQHSDANDLVRWLAERGGCSTVSIATDAHGLRGLTADRAFTVGDVLLEVPLNHVLSDTNGPRDECGLRGAAPDWAASLPSKVQLALLVATLAADPGSEWAPFLRSWPTSMPDVPSDADLLALGSNSAPDSADSWRRTWARSTTATWLDAQHALAAAAHAQHARAVDTRAAAAFPSRASFRTALRLVGSRCLHLSAGRYGQRRLLVPLLDMANHDGARPSAVYQFRDAAEAADVPSGGGVAADTARTASIQLVAARPLAAGDAVTICYGTHTNAEFVRAYGFVPDDNSHDCDVVSLRQLLDAALAAGYTSSRPGVRERLTDVEAAVAAVGACSFSTSGLRLYAHAPAEETVLALRAVLSADHGAALAAWLEAVAMEDAEEEDEEEWLHDDEEESSTADALAADCAAILAAACVTLEGALAEGARAWKGSETKEPERAQVLHGGSRAVFRGDGRPAPGEWAADGQGESWGASLLRGGDTAPHAISSEARLLLEQLRASRMQLLRKLRLSMADVAAEPHSARAMLDEKQHQQALYDSVSGTAV